METLHFYLTELELINSPHTKIGFSNLQTGIVSSRNSSRFFIKPELTFSINSRFMHEIKSSFFPSFHNVLIDMIYVNIATANYLLETMKSIEYVCKWWFYWQTSHETMHRVCVMPLFICWKMEIFAWSNRHTIHDVSKKCHRISADFCLDKENFNMMTSSMASFERGASWWVMFSSK